MRCTSRVRAQRSAGSRGGCSMHSSEEKLRPPRLALVEAEAAARLPAMHMCLCSLQLHCAVQLPRLKWLLAHACLAGIASAPLWDGEQGRVCGMLSASDFIHMLQVGEQPQQLVFYARTCVH